MRFSPAGRPSMAMPVVGRYIASERAQRHGNALRREVIPEERRKEWVDRRKSSIVRDVRLLQKALQGAKAPVMFTGDSPPEVEKFWDISVVSREEDFVAFINMMNRCYVEPIERVGKRAGKRDYFWNDTKTAIPELWSALHRIKVYRHRFDHLELEPGTEQACAEFLQSDLEGRALGGAPDGWFILQQVVLDELLVGIQCGLNRYT